MINTVIFHNVFHAILGKTQLLSFLISFLALSCAKQPRHQTIAVLAASLVDVLWLEKWNAATPASHFDETVLLRSAFANLLKRSATLSFVYDLSWCMTKG